MPAVKKYEEFPHSGSLTKKELRCNMCRNGHDLSQHLRIKGKVKQPHCRECYKAWSKAYRAKFPGKYSHLGTASMRRIRYGVTAVQYAEMLARQAGLCAICGRPDSAQALGVDHNHETGKVRELLCSACNQTLGKVRESKEILQKMIIYLDKWSV